MAIWQLQKYSGIVTFSPSFTTQDILFVFEFHMNLLSVPKLCFDLDIIVIFNNPKCLIQEKKGLKMIGSSDLVEGSYYHIDTQTSHEANTI